MMKEKNGITLIALVITIIVLLILAGVTINMTITNDGILGKAGTAAEKWDTAVSDEETTLTNLLEMVNNLGETIEDDISTPTLPTGWDSKKVESTVTETSLITGTNKERIVPIPVGFTVSQIGEENTIANGLVIYQIPEDATVDWNASTITIGQNTTNLQETVNQYVWVPVDDINQMVMCKLNNANNDGTVCSIELQTDGTLNCSTHSSTDLCGRLYGTDDSSLNVNGKYIYKTSMNFENRNQQWSDTGYREPDIITTYDTNHNTGNLENFTSQMTTDFINMAVSIAKYGGFYVSRYEAGENGASKKNQVVLTAALSDGSVYKGMDMWYGLYNAVRNEIVVGTNAIMQSCMIYGSQYDQIINFLESDSSNTPQEGHIDRQLATQDLTGANEADVMNNIYDLEGNNREWTAQAQSNDRRVNRSVGFVSLSYNNYYSASGRYGNYANMYENNYSTRIALYF